MAYITRRPFRSMGVMYLPGDIVEDPRTIRLFRTKLKYGIIVGEVDETDEPSSLDENTKPDETGEVNELPQGENLIPPSDVDVTPPEQLSPPQIIPSESTPPATLVVGAVLQVGNISGDN